MREDEALICATHRAIDEVTRTIDGFAFNKAVAKLYELTNTLSRSAAGAEAKRQTMRVMAQLMSPMVPHLAEEVWALLDGEGMVVSAPGQGRSRPAGGGQRDPAHPDQRQAAERDHCAEGHAAGGGGEARPADETVVKVLAGAAPRKLIVVPGRIVNVVA